jgi:hypothetical protein
MISPCVQQLRDVSWPVRSTIELMQFAYGQFLHSASRLIAAGAACVCFCCNACSWGVFCLRARGSNDRDCRNRVGRSINDAASIDSDSKAIGIKLKSRMLPVVALLGRDVELERSRMDTHVACQKPADNAALPGTACRID